MVEHMIAMGDQNIQYASWSLLKEYTVVDRSFLIVTESLFINGVSNCSSINWRCTNENLRLSPSSYLIVDHELKQESIQNLKFKLSIQNLRIYLLQCTLLIKTILHIGYFDRPWQSYAQPLLNLKFKSWMDFFVSSWSTIK